MQEDKTIMAGTALLAAVLVAAILARSRWLATWLAIAAAQQGLPGDIARYADYILTGVALLAIVALAVVLWRRPRQ